MPELPEVETTLRGISPHVTGKTILELILRTSRLRFPLDHKLPLLLTGQRVLRVTRRAKYLLLHCDLGTLIIHLGMSGSLRIVPAGTTERKHDHVDLIFSDGNCLRFSDPRKFGAFLFTTEPPEQHRLLQGLGPEPLEAPFDGDYLFNQSRQRKLAVKPFIMDQHVVVGVGNIYANEALFRSGIHPARSAGKISRQRFLTLAEEIKLVLQKSIAAGGTTINDFQQSDGRPGYFKQELAIYGREGDACILCGGPIKCTRLAQRSTYYCPHCQR